MTGRQYDPALVEAGVSGASIAVDDAAGRIRAAIDAAREGQS